MHVSAKDVINPARLSSLLDARREQFASLAHAWLTSGAGSFSVWADGQPLMTWPRDPSPPHAGMRTCSGMHTHSGVAAPIIVQDHTIGELRVSAPDTPAVRARLGADARLIAQLADLEGEIEDLTAELIENQDQLLALYNLTRFHRRTQPARALVDVQSMLDSLAHEVARLTETRCACFFLVDARGVPGGEPLVSQSPEPFIALKTLMDLFQRARANKRELMLTSDDLPPALQDTTGTLLVIPTDVRGTRCAGILLAVPQGIKVTSPDLKLAFTISEQVSAQVENALLYQELLERTKLQTEMELAKQVQARLLPQRIARVPGLDVAARSRAALQVGGDFYDLIFRPGNPFIFTVGDVTGKGMSAALIMAMSHTVLRSAANFMPDPTPQNLLRRLNENLYADLTDLSLFVTTFTGHYNPVGRELACSNAGHSPVIYKPARGHARLLEADSPPIGVLPESLADTLAFTFQPGDVLVVATDGFSEARNADDELYGNERFAQRVEELSTRPAQAIADGLFETIDQFATGHTQDDDQTLVVLKGVKE